jgi:uncharacterized protein
LFKAGNHIEVYTMKIAVSGFRGLIGNALLKELSAEGHEIVRLPRKVLYDHTGKELKELLEGTQAVIHLAGSPILKRWNKKNREVMYHSRVTTTRNLVSAIKLVPADLRPEIFIAASAIGIYENSISHTENSTRFARHFASELICNWEEASLDLPDNVRRIIIRTGLVIDRNALMIRMLRVPFLLGIGGPVGTGRQPMPFIHLADVTGSIIWLLKNGQSKGVYNLVAPEQISNSDFSKLFARKLKRPCLINVPAFALRLLYGQAAQMITESPAVVPERLSTEGYPFRYAHLNEALNEVLQEAKPSLQK